MTALATRDAMTLEQKRAVANEEHRATIKAVRAALPHAIRAGEALLSVRDEVPQGQWIEWLEQNFEGSRGTANAYMRLAYYQDRIPSGASREDALLLLRGLPWRTGQTTRQGNMRLQRAKRRARNARKALQREEEARLVKKRGGTVAHGYALIRKAEQELDRAYAEEQDTEAKQAIFTALARLHSAEDEVARAVRVGKRN